jgi:hypothetical protein
MTTEPFELHSSPLEAVETEEEVFVLEWRDYQRDAIAYLRSLVLGLKSEKRPRTRFIRGVAACAALCQLLEHVQSGLPNGPLLWIDLVVLVKIEGLLLEAPWNPPPEEGKYPSVECVKLNEVGLPPVTPALIDYVAAIDPNELADILQLADTRREIHSGPLGHRQTGAESPNDEKTEQAHERRRLGELVLKEYQKGVPFKQIAAMIEDAANWGSGWNEDRVNKELNRHCEGLGIDRPRRKRRRNRQDGDNKQRNRRDAV